MKRRGRSPYPDVLTPSEWEVLGFLREGFSNEQIAERLGITLRTAKFHVSEILSKLGVGSREEAAAWTPDAPVPTRRWLAWPLAARIAGPLIVVAAIAGLGALALGVLRTSGGDDHLTLADVNVEPEEAIVRALSAMDELKSYRAEIVMESTDEALAVTVDLTRPLEYRVAFGIGDVIPVMVTSGDKLYIKDCLSDDCPWLQLDKPEVVSSFVLSGVLEPEWIPITALEIATDWQAIAVESEEGQPLLHLRGQVNQLKSNYLNQERAYAHAGVTDFGNSCDEDIYPPPRPETCHELTFDELFWQGSDTGPLDIETASLYPVDAWISVDDWHVRRVTISPPSGGIPESDQSQFTKYTTSYSRFDAISFAAPEQYIVETPTPIP
jgi:DNA-binding CsgD family transcriptional regulator